MINEVKWNNHNVLGDLELDFSKPDGSVYNTIVLAGENGTGKTTVLETLAEFLNVGSIEPFEYIGYIVNNTPYMLTWDKEADPKCGFHRRTNIRTNDIKRIMYSKAVSDIERLNQDTEDIRYYGFAYSKARSGFSTKAVTSSTTQQLDSEKFEIDSNDDFTSIKQLIVDIDSQDNAEWMRVSQQDNPPRINDFKPNSKKYRFTKAFNNFFNTIEYDSVDNANSQEKTILFKKNDKYIPVDSLSTGEKQIVFRGAHLLKNINSVSEGIVLIDEPELSMHPKWQEKILQYYRGLFSSNDGQSAQIIIATHSEYVLRSALDDKDNVLIIALQNEDDSITHKNIVAPNVLPTITSAEINYLAFGIVSSDYHIELYGHLQNKTEKDRIMEIDEYISGHRLYDSTLHEKASSYKKSKYKTLPTYIRNAIDHPQPDRKYTQIELQCSIELLIKLCSETP